MRFKLSIAIFTVVIASHSALAQSVLRTLLGATPENLPALSAALNTPSAVVAGPNGDVYAAIKGGHRVVRIDGNGTIWLVAGNGNQGSAGDGGLATGAGLSSPVSLAFDHSGNLYICDSTTNRIRRVGADGIITTVVGTGAGTGADGSPASAANLSSPSAIAFDAGGNLLIADTGNHVVRVVTPDRIVNTLAGN